MKEQIDAILKQVKSQHAAKWKVDIDGRSYVRNFKTKDRLIILGGGNVGQEICKYAASLEFHVVIVDDRPSFANHLLHPQADEIYCDGFVNAIEKLAICDRDYVTIVTRGHQYDMECIQTILKGTMPYYLGMMGSRRRIKGVIEILQEEGFDEARINQVHMPIGLPIHALTTAEIGISIAAELICVRREEIKKTEASNQLVCQDVDPRFVDFLERDNSPKALLLVYGTQGSTPVKSGAVMVVNQAMQTAGTIGGGCTEGIAIREAMRIIGTGRETTLFLDMCNDVAAEEGMACGGTMQVWITDLC